MSTRILCRIDHTLRYLITLLFSAKEPIRYSRSRLSIPSSLKTRLSLREPFDFLPLVTQRRTPIGTSEVALRLLLIVVAFYMSRGIRLFASGPQIPASGFGLEHISTCNCSFALLRLPKPYSSFPSPLRRSNHG